MVEQMKNGEEDELVVYKILSETAEWEPVVSNLVEHS